MEVRAPFKEDANSPREMQSMLALAAGLQALRINLRRYLELKSIVWNISRETQAENLIAIHTESVVGLTTSIAGASGATGSTTGCGYECFRAWNLILWIPCGATCGVTSLEISQGRAALF